MNNSKHIRLSCCSSGPLQWVSGRLPSTRIRWHANVGHAAPLAAAMTVYTAVTWRHTHTLCTSNSMSSHSLRRGDGRKKKNAFNTFAHVYRHFRLHTHTHIFFFLKNVRMCVEDVLCVLWLWQAVIYFFPLPPLHTCGSFTFMLIQIMKLSIRGILWWEQWTQLPPAACEMGWQTRRQMGAAALGRQSNHIHLACFPSPPPPPPPTTHPSYAPHRYREPQVFRLPPDLKRSHILHLLEEEEEEEEEEEVREKGFLRAR